MTATATDNVQPAKLHITRKFVKVGVDPFSTVDWKIVDAVIVDAGGKEKFRQNGVEVPAWWNETTINIVAEKYFRVINGEKETSAKQMFHRVAYWLALNGVKQGIFDGVIVKGNGLLDDSFQSEDAYAFYDELIYMGIHGMHAFNSPVWFNVGVVKDPQCSACFIQSAKDTMNDIMDLAKREVMLFKGGSGTGSNLSSIRSSWEKISRGGRPSGPVSFMKGNDAFAGVTKSGGTTRRAAKMVILNVDHPDILEQRNGEPGFIGCKAAAEKIAQDLYSTGKYTAEWNIPGNVYDLVGYQNANNSVRVTDEFMRAVESDDIWEVKEVKTGKVVKTYKAKDIWKSIADAAWLCGDPGLQFDTVTNEWHTCKESGHINASNPCSEYLFLDDTACNLSSLNVLKFADGKKFKTHDFSHACEIAITAKEIIVDASSYPSFELASNSHKYRTLGLGYTNIGALLTYWGIPYDSNEGRSIVAGITSLMCGAAYAQSARLAGVLGPFPAYQENKKSMLDVINKHADNIPPILGGSWDHIIVESIKQWRKALELGKTNGYRNAQTTVIAPTGTISFLMGADTTGMEPMLGILIYKKIVGEGLLKMPNQIVEPALINLGYGKEVVDNILAYIAENGTIHGAPGFDPKHGAVFAEALGSNSMKPEAHIDMMAAAQPFLSGGISKTVNMPNSCTPDDIANVYMRAWKAGLKCVAVFRDGCKLSQPISTSLTDNSKKDILAWGQRKKLPDTRPARIHKFSVGGQDGYIIPGEYKDGTLAEIFINVAQAGSTLHGFLDAWATAISIGIQHGVPFSVLREKHTGMRFEPTGFTTNPDIPMAKSIPDYIFRWLDLTYGDRVSELKNIAVVEKAKIVSISYDGPPCHACGNLTKRTGSCYCCTTCGTTTGCS